ncbi:MAG: DUF1599 domain-containing protein [Bacteroidota bacterium]
MIQRCKQLFVAKSHDYGTAWTVLRMPSITDQIFIKAERIKSIQESGENKVGDSVEGEFVAIINYCIIALILLDWQEKTEAELEQALQTSEALEKLYDAKAQFAFDVMQQKNHDYGEAWRSMRISSITDLIRMKLYRLKRIEDNAGKTLVSEGVDANYVDMLNYAAFVLIRVDEGEKP